MRGLWAEISGSFWFLPSAIMFASIALAVILISTDFAANKPWMARWPNLFGAGADGARGMLSTIAGSMMTVLGVTLSMTLVTLALASSQYTSRILRNFIRDRVTQVVLGSFAGIYSYCLIVIRTIRGGDEGGFIPGLAVLLGVVFAIAGISLLIYFLHHIATSIQASNIIASVAGETLAAVKHIYSRDAAGETDRHVEMPVALAEGQWRAVTAERDGYIQNVAYDALASLAERERITVRMERSVGDFVVCGTTLLAVHPSDTGEDCIRHLQAAVAINRYRSVEHDPGFGIRQLADIALRALSPGINDTTTAVMCIDYLTAILSRISTLHIPSSVYSGNGELLLVINGPTFSEMVDEPFDEIRANGTGNVTVMLRLMDALSTLGTFTAHPERRHVLRRHLDWLRESISLPSLTAHDRQRLEERLSSVRLKLDSQVTEDSGVHNAQVS